MKLLLSLKPGWQCRARETAIELRVHLEPRAKVEGHFSVMRGRIDCRFFSGQLPRQSKRHSGAKIHRSYNADAAALQN
jgi:hypothetical protein